jgi:signal transduction histidine kinase/ActR/RegA family two-component response regulator
MTFSEEITAGKDADESARRNELRLRLALDAAAMISFDWDITRDEVRRFELTDAGSPPRLKTFKNFAAVLEAVHPEDREAFLANVRAALASKDGRYETEIRVVHPDGEIAWYHERGRVERDASGRPSRLIGVAQDITERKRAEAALREADRRKDEFLATLAHELRNPLAPICNGLAALKLGTKTKEDADHIISTMERQSEHLVRLVDDLLEVSRISHGVIGLAKEGVSLAVVIGDALDMNREVIDAAGLELRVSLPDEPVLLDADGVRLTQVFANLLNNAAKYTDAGGRINIEAKRVNDHLVVSVTDTGVGIAKDMLPRVFDLFSRSGDRYSRLTGGLGIGLALVRNLVELHGGTVAAQSEGEGRGACFVVRLPCVAKIETGAQACAMSATQGQTSPRVLIVDDAPAVADSLAFLLKALGAEVRVALSGAEGLEICAEFAPELVFLDIGMPGMDGFETARRMRRSPAGQKAVLVALTGWGEEETRRRAIEAGFDRHLRKPAGSRELQALLETRRNSSCG